MATIKHSGWARLLPPLGIVLGVLLAAALLLQWVAGDDGSAADDARLQAGRMDVAAALSGDASALQRLRDLHSSLDAAPAVTGAGEWARIDAGLTALTGAGDDIAAFHAARDRLETLLPEMLVSVSGLMSSLPPPRLQVSEPELARFEASIQGLDYTVRTLGTPAAGPQAAAQPGAVFAQAATELADSRDYLNNFAASLNGIGAIEAVAVAGAVAAADLQATTVLIGSASEAIGELIAGTGRMQMLMPAAAGFDAAAAEFHASAAPPGGGLLASAGFYLLLGAFVVMLLMLFAYYQARDYRRAAELQAEQSERDQQAILRLLDELSSLADGDLTVEATVTEDITGAIADSINYAIDALRELVATVNESSILVDAASKQTEATASQLVRSSDVQAKQAAAASESVAKMAASVEEISGDSERCADVARYAVDIAHKGGEAVRRTIDGMNTIRETIQDTSKRIKRLGESSQEIGNIVELIEEIAEQTNILALNASIEASRAGEASRGFAVVADEVQKLAERSTNATRKIEVLVSTIQSDTNEAVVSMERSTTDVVGGALLAENAGAALDEIEQVSHQIASLVQNISGTASGQSRVSAAISKNMEVLRQISTRNRKSTAAASDHIQRLSELASQLRQTVRGFRLPDDVTATGILSQAKVAESLKRESEIEFDDADPVRARQTV